MTGNSLFDWDRLIQQLVRELAELRTKKIKIETLDDVKKVKLPASVMTAVPILLGPAITELETAQEKVREQHQTRLEDQRKKLLAQQRWDEDVVERRKEEATAPEKDKFVVAGRIVDKESGLGLPRVIIQVWDHDTTRPKDDPLGRVLTDEFGYFRQIYAAKEFEDPDKKAELYLTVEDEARKQIFKSRIQYESGKVEFLAEKIDGDQLPRSLELAKIYDRDRTARRAAHKRQLRSIEAQRKFTLRRSGQRPPSRKPQPPKTRR
jgi:uncharacterized protein YciI